MLVSSQLMGSEYYEHKLIKPNSIELRDYQVNLANEAKNENSLVVLPTGLGKTTIALQIMAHVLSGLSSGGSKSALGARFQQRLDSLERSSLRDIPES